MKNPLCIFLAEDNPADVDLVEEALREHHINYVLKLVQDGTAAKQYIEKMENHADCPCPDIVLLDLNLPRASGFELFASFREHPRCRKTPIIFVTSSNAPPDREMAASLGAARYFRKPTDLADFMELGAVIREVVQHSGSDRI